MLATDHWLPLRERFHGAAAALELRMDEMSLEAISPSFDIIRAVKNLPLGELLVYPVREGFEASAVKAFAESYRKTRGVTLKDASQSFLFDDDDQDLVLSDQLALDWLEVRGLDLAERIGRKSREAIVETLQAGMVEGKSIPAMVKEIKTVVGLNTRQAKAVANRRRRLEARGLKQEKVNADIERYRKKLIRDRAEMIARTETVSARNQGQLHAWREMLKERELPSGSRKIWIDAERLACPICRELASQKSVPINKPFLSTSVGALMCPPAHPNCRCSMGLG